VPAYNAGETLAQCLQAVFKSDERNIEVIVVDDGSTDATSKIASSFPYVKLIQKKNSGSAAARNCGARVARGKYYYFLDSDVIIPSHVISRFIETARGFRADLVLGRYSTRPMNSGLVHHYKALFDYVISIPASKRHQVIINGQCGGGGDFYSAAAFKELGGYNEAYLGASVEREELFIRFFEAGFRSAVNPMIATRHFFPDLLPLIKTYIYRIYRFVELLEDRRPPYSFTYISLEKSIIAPIVAALTLFMFLFAYLGSVPWSLSFLLMAIFLLVNRDFMLTGIKKKGFFTTIKMLPINFFMYNLIFVVGTGSKIIAKWRRCCG